MPSLFSGNNSSQLLKLSMLISKILRPRIQGKQTHFQGRQFCQNHCLPSEKVSTLKGKFFPYGSKLFPFRIDSFSEGTWHAGERSLMSCLPCTNRPKIYQVYPVPSDSKLYRPTSSCVVLAENFANSIITRQSDYGIIYTPSQHQSINKP